MFLNRVGESPRWLLRQGRFEEAEREIRRMAKMNGRELPSNLWAGEQLIEGTKEVALAKGCDSPH